MTSYRREDYSDTDNESGSENEYGSEDEYGSELGFEGHDYQLDKYNQSDDEDVVPTQEFDGMIDINDYTDNAGYSSTATETNSDEEVINTLKRMVRDMELEKKKKNSDESEYLHSHTDNYGDVVVIECGEEQTSINQPDPHLESLDALIGEGEGKLSKARAVRMIFSVSKSGSYDDLLTLVKQLNAKHKISLQMLRYFKGDQYGSLDVLIERWEKGLNRLYAHKTQHIKRNGPVTPTKPCKHPRTDNHNGMIICIECGEELEDVSIYGPNFSGTKYWETLERRKINAIKHKKELAEYNVTRERLVTAKEKLITARETGSDLSLRELRDAARSQGVKCITSISKATLRERLGITLSNSEASKVTEGRYKDGVTKTVGILLTNVVTNEVRKFKSLSDVGKIIGKKAASVSYYIKKGKEVRIGDDMFTIQRES